MEHVQTKEEIVRILNTAGLRPRKRFGQHFLIDGNLMRRLVESAALEPEDHVLEVGGGTGGLTDLIAARVRTLLCVEVDRKLCAILADRFAGAAGFRLIQGDVLSNKHTLHPDVADAIQRVEEEGDGNVKLVANLPYQVATPLVMNLLVDYPAVRRMCFTVQAEVGRRFLAKPGEKDFGPLSIVSQTLGQVEVVAKVPPQSFWPRPAVHSMMLRLSVTETPFSDPKEPSRFARLVRGAFDHRRKTLRSALGYVVDEEVRDRICQSCDASRRPESISAEEWVDLYHVASTGLTC